MTQVINEAVHVSAYYFGKDMSSYPKSIKYQGKAISFSEGLRYAVHRGQAVIQLFDMSADDGSSTYRLRRTDNSWVLLGMKGAC